MLLDQSEREEFAKNIISAVNLSGSYEGGKFVENFKYLGGIHMTASGEDKIIEWIKYGSGAMSKTCDAVKKNYASPKAVYDLLVAEVKPLLN